MQVTTYLRHLNIDNIQYIDDRLLIFRPHDNASNLSRGNHEHVYILLQFLKRLGYTLALQKIFRINYWLWETSKHAAYGKEKNITLQRFAEKCILTHLAIPASKLYTREINRAISVCKKNQISLELRTEIEHWRFVDDWNGRNQSLIITIPGDGCVLLPIQYTIDIMWKQWHLSLPNDECTDAINHLA